MSERIKLLFLLKDLRREVRISSSALADSGTRLITVPPLIVPTLTVSRLS